MSKTGITAITMTTGEESVIVSPEALAIREALWFWSGKITELGSGYFRRSRPEAALLLPTTAATLYASIHLDYIGNEWVVSVAGKMGFRQDWLDALSAAVLAAFKAQERP